MPARPTQGQSSGTWGTELDAYLDVSHDPATGNLLPAAVRAALGGLVTATGDITISSDTDASGAGDIIFSSGGVERGRIKFDGTGTGIFANTATTTELTAQTFLNGTISVTASFGVWIAPFAAKVTYASVVNWGGAVAADNTNYWTVDVNRYRANVITTIATKTTQLTGGVAMAQRTDWNFNAVTFDPTNQILQAGDQVGIKFTTTGAPTAIPTALLVIRYEPT